MITTTATLFAQALALAPPNNPVPFDVADVEIVAGPDSVHLLTFDADGEQSGSIEVWLDSTNIVSIEADFADGLYLSQSIGAEVESNDAAEVASRMTAIDGFVVTRIAPDHQPQESREGWCMVSVLSAGWCVTGNVLGCMAAGVGIACNCLELVGDYPPGCGY